MKRTIVLICAGLLVISCNMSEDPTTDGKENSESKLGESYGEYEVNPEEAVSVEKMLAMFEGQSEEMEFTFESELNEICAKAGCWVNIDKGNGETFMVRFKDHFTIPPDTDPGTGAFIHGVAFWDTVSVDLQRHFMEDAGGSEEDQMAITEPKYALGFTGDGIVLKK